MYLVITEWLNVSNENFIIHLKVFRNFITHLKVLRMGSVVPLQKSSPQRERKSQLLEEIRLPLRLAVISRREKEKAIALPKLRCTLVFDMH